jgi:hypothetical protein
MDEPSKAMTPDSNIPAGYTHRVITASGRTVYSADKERCDQYIQEAGEPLGWQVQEFWFPLSLGHRGDEEQAANRIAGAKGLTEAAIAKANQMSQVKP